MRLSRARRPAMGAAPPVSHLRRLVASGPMRAAVLFAVLMAPWPWLPRWYVGAVAGIGNALVGAANPDVPLTFSVADTGGDAGVSGPWQLDVGADDHLTGKFVRTALDLRRGGYIASAVFAALALATRVPWRRRLALLGAGLLPLQLLPLLPVWSFFSGKLAVQVFHFGPVGWALSDIAYHTLVAPPGMAYAVPALLWVVLVWVVAPGSLPRLGTWPRSQSNPA